MKHFFFILPLALTLSSLTLPQAVNARPQNKSVGEPNTPTANTNERNKALVAAVAIPDWDPARDSTGASSSVATQVAEKVASEQAEQEIVRVERELTEALSQGDFATVERVYAEDYALTTADGELQNKAQRIAALKATDPKSVARNRDDITVRVYGETAVVTGHTLFNTQAQGGPNTENRRFTHVWVKRQRRWQMVASQVTRIADHPNAARQAIRESPDSEPSSSSLDAVTAEPKHYKIDFENDRVRVVRVQYGPHEKSVVMHQHPGNSVGIYVRDFHAKVTFPEGKIREVDAKAGRTFWRAPAVTHASTENLSDQPMEALWVELKPLSATRGTIANSETTDAAEANKALVRRYIEATNTHGHGDEAVLNEFIAPDFVRHGGKELRGIDSFKQNGARVQAAYPDWKWTIEDTVAEGDKVVVRMTGTGTHRGEFGTGIAPTGKRVNLGVVMIYRIAGGKIVEQWRTADDLGRLLQLGATIAAPEEQDRNPQSEAEARRVIDAFNRANTERDVEGLRNALNFPFIRIASGKVRITRTREEFTSDAPPGAIAEGWHHSTVDSVQFIQSSSDKVHAAVVFSRYKADGTRYATYRTLRIITKQDGHWGIQCSSSFAP